MSEIEPKLGSTWRKSSQSQGGGCVEVCHVGREVHVRDSKNPAAGVLVFTDHEWRAFLGGVLLGEFTLPAPEPTA